MLAGVWVGVAVAGPPGVFVDVGVGAGLCVGVAVAGPPGVGVEV